MFAINLKNKNILLAFSKLKSLIKITHDQFVKYNKNVCIVVLHRWIVMISNWTASFQIDWTTGFKDNSNPDCEDVDFMVMMHPKNKPSSYKISDFTLKGQRSTTLHIEKDLDYVFQAWLSRFFILNWSRDFELFFQFSLFLLLEP